MLSISIWQFLVLIIISFALQPPRELHNKGNEISFLHSKQYLILNEDEQGKK